MRCMEQSAYYKMHIEPRDIPDKHDGGVGKMEDSVTDGNCDGESDIELVIQGGVD